MQQYQFIEMKQSIIYIFLFLFVLSFSQEQVYPRLGGVSDVSAEELQKFLGQQMTQTAISKIKQEFQKKYNTNLQIKKYLYGKTQVVAGQIITLGFQTSNGNQYEAAVWLKVWMNFVQLQYLKQINSLSSQPQTTDLPNVENQTPERVATAEPISEIQVNHLDGGVNDVPAEELQNFLDSQLTKMAIQKIKEEFNSKYNKELTIKNYLYGKSQIVAGQIITLGFQTTNGGKYEAAVLLQTWMNIVQVRYLKQINEISSLPTKLNLQNVQAPVPQRVATSMPLLGATNYPKVAQTQAPSTPSIIPQALPFRGQKIQIISNPSTSMTFNVELPKFFDQSAHSNHKNCKSLNCKHLKVGNRIRY